MKHYSRLLTAVLFSCAVILSTLCIKSVFAQAVAQTGEKPAEIVTLECSYDGYPSWLPFIVDVNKTNKTVTTTHVSQEISGSYIPHTVGGPYQARIDEKLISWHWQDANSKQSGDTYIDRMTGKALDTVYIDSKVEHTPWSCHVMERKF